MEYVINTVAVSIILFGLNVDIPGVGFFRSMLALVSAIALLKESESISSILLALLS